jgi:hypothetical protein
MILVPRARIPHSPAALLLALVALLVAPRSSWGRESDYSDWLPLTPLDWTAQANEALGIRHAVRIFDGTQVDERPGIEGKRVRYSYYHRVRVLDAEGIEAFRTLEIEAPLDGRIAALAAQVVKPDGRVLPVEGREIREKKVISRGGDVLKARTLAFPSVDPGDILEWRYTVEREWGWVPRIQFRQEHYTLRAELTWWYPVLEAVAGDVLQLREMVYEPHYILVNAPAAGVTVKALPENAPVDHLQITMYNLAALPDEPYLPAVAEIATYFVGWYAFPRKDAVAPYWRRVADELGKETDDFLHANRRLDTWMKEISARPRNLDADLEACLALLHRTVRNLGDLPEAELPEEPPQYKDAEDVLDAGRGNDYDLSALYTGMLRRLGYAATVFHASSREDGFFIEKWENPGQLQLCGTAVAAPGDQVRWIFPSYEGGTTRTLPWMAQDGTALLERAGKKEIAARFPLTASLPVGEAGVNRIDMATTLRLDPGGDLVGRLRATWSCESDPDLRREVVRQRGQGAADFLKGRLAGIGSSFRTWDESAGVDSTGVVYACSLRAGGLVLAAGSRTLVSLDHFRSDDYSLPDQRREFQVHFRYPKLTHSRVELALPDGDALEAAAADSLSTEFLIYRCASASTGATVVRDREFDLLYNIFVPAGADTLRKLFQTVREADRKPVVLAPGKGGP